MADSVSKAYLNSVVLFEELTDKEERDADRMKAYGRDAYLEAFHAKHPKAQELFSQYQDTVKYRARMPISFDEKATEPHQSVTSFLTQHGYTFNNDDYKSGIAHSTKTVGDPDRGIPYTTKKTAHKIGGLLEKHSAPEDIKKNFMNDPYRIGAKTKQFDMIITANHRDIYGGSTGRGWTSCADKRSRPSNHPWGRYDGNGPASRHIPQEINNHTHMVYLVPHGGDLDTTAMGRLSFKKYHSLMSNHETLIAEPREYGTPPKEFQSAAKKTMSMLFPMNPGEVYAKNTEVYHDGSPRYVFPNESHVTGEQLDAVMKHAKKYKDPWITATLHKYIRPDEKYKTHEARNIAKAMKQFGDTVDGKHSQEEPHNVFQHAMQAAQTLDAIPEKTSMHLVENTHVKDMIERAAKHFDITRPDHIAAIVNTIYPQDVTRSLIKHATMNLAARNYTEFKHIGMLADAGHYSGINRYKVELADKHQMGKDPFEHIIHAASNAGELNADMLVKAFHSAADKTRRRGNIYDHAIHFERNGVPGMSAALDEMARKRVESSARSRWPGQSLHDELAKILYVTRPENRERLASAFNVGMDHKQIMKAGKAGIDAEKELYKTIKQKKLEEGFDFYDDLETNDYDVMEINSIQ